jgi:hypothetical protein
MMPLHGLGKLQKFSYLIGNRTRELPACRMAHQSSTVPCAFIIIIIIIIIRKYSTHLRD